MTNSKVRVTNHYKQIECTKKLYNLERLRNILMQIKSEKEQRLIYGKKVNK